MATGVPWSGSEFQIELEQKLGSNWEQQLEGKWGSGWQESCARELAYDLGDDWAGYPQAAVQKLVEVLAGPGESARAPVTEQQRLDPNQPLSIDFGQYQWLNSVAQAGSLQSWLVRIGVPETQATELATEDGGASGAVGQQVSGAPSRVDLNRFQWLKTVHESDSLDSWLVRIGVPAEQATALADPNGGTSSPESAPRRQVDLNSFQWLRTVHESDSLHSWLVRVGVPAEQATALTEAQQ